MVECNYTFMRTTQSTEKVTLPVYLRFLPDQISRKWKSKWVDKKLPIEKEKIEILGIPGWNIKLPYTEAELKDRKPEEIQEIYDRIAHRESLQNIIVDHSMEKRLDTAFYMDGSLIIRLFIEEIFQWVKREHQLLVGKMKPIILEPGDNSIGWVLENLPQDLNFLSIVTSRLQFFDQFAESMLENQGLLIQLISEPLSMKLEGNIILDFRCGEEKEYRFIPENAIYIDFSGIKKKARDIIVKRKDLFYYNSIEVGDNEKVYDIRLLQAILCSQNIQEQKQFMGAKRDKLKEFNIQLKKLTVEVLK